MWQMSFIDMAIMDNCFVIDSPNSIEQESGEKCLAAERKRWTELHFQRTSIKFI